MQGRASPLAGAQRTAEPQQHFVQAPYCCCHHGNAQCCAWLRVSGRACGLPPCSQLSRVHVVWMLGCLVSVRALACSLLTVCGRTLEMYNRSSGCRSVCFVWSATREVWVFCSGARRLVQGVQLHACTGACDPAVLSCTFLVPTGVACMQSYAGATTVHVSTLCATACMRLLLCRAERHQDFFGAHVCAIVGASGPGACQQAVCCTERRPASCAWKQKGACMVVCGCFVREVCWAFVLCPRGPSLSEPLFQLVGFAPLHKWPLG